MNRTQVSRDAALRTLADWVGFAYAPTLLVLESTFPTSSVCMMAPQVSIQTRFVKFISVIKKNPVVKKKKEVLLILF